MHQHKLRQVSRLAHKVGHHECHSIQEGCGVSVCVCARTVNYKLHVCAHKCVTEDKRGSTKTRRSIDVYSGTRPCMWRGEGRHTQQVM